MSAFSEALEYKEIYTRKQPGTTVLCYRFILDFVRQGPDLIALSFGMDC